MSVKPVDLIAVQTRLQSLKLRAPEIDYGPLDQLVAEVERLRRAIAEGLPREILYCPQCHAQHLEGPRHDDPTVDGRVRGHHTHRCYRCGHDWDAGHWSFGAKENTWTPAVEKALVWLLQRLNPTVTAAELATVLGVSEVRVHTMLLAPFAKPR